MATHSPLTFHGRSISQARYDARKRETKPSHLRWDRVAIVLGCAVFHVAWIGGVVSILH